MFLSDKEKNEREQYNKFLAEAMLLEEADAIPVPTVHDSLAKKVRDWDGTGPLPHTAEDEGMLDSLVDKILKKEPEDEGTDDPLRPTETGIQENAKKLRKKAKKLREEADEAEEAAEKAEEAAEKADDKKDDEECDDCDKNIEEMFRELGISPIDLLEGDDEDDEDDDDDDEDDDDDKDEKEESDVEESFSEDEKSILKQLLHEMSLFEESEDEFADSADDDIEKKEKSEKGDEDDDEDELDED